MPTVLDPSQLTPRFQQALAYWQSKLSGRAMPSRRDIDPVDIPRLLPYLMLLDVLPEPLDFRYRLIGTEVRAVLAQDYTGRLLSELPGKGKGSVVWDNCEQVVLARAPITRSPPYVGPDRDLRRCKNLLLPLSENGSDVSMIVMVADFERSRG